MIVAMDHLGYVVAAWGGSALLLAGYAVSLVTRGRKLSRQVPPEDRRWS